MFSGAQITIAGVVLVVVLGLGLTAAIYRGNAIDAEAERDKALADLGVAVDANKVQEETIGRMRAQEAENDRLLAQLAGSVAAINDNLAKTTRELSELKDADPAVHDYLDSPVPGPLQRMYDKRPAGDRRDAADPRKGP